MQETGKARRAVTLCCKSLIMQSLSLRSCTEHLFYIQKELCTCMKRINCGPNLTLFGPAKNVCSSQTVQPKSHISRQILLSKINQDFLLRVRLNQLLHSCGRVDPTFLHPSLLLFPLFVLLFDSLFKDWQKLLLSRMLSPKRMKANGIMHIAKLRKPSNEQAHATPKR